MPRVAPRDANEIDRLVMGAPKTSGARVKELLDLGMQQEALQLIDHMPYEEVQKLASLFKSAEEAVPDVAAENQPTEPPKPDTADVSDTTDAAPPATPEPTEGAPENLEESKAARKKTAEESCSGSEGAKPEDKPEDKPAESEASPIDETALALSAEGAPTPEAEKAARLGYLCGLKTAAQAILTRAAQRQAMTKQAAQNPQAQLERLLDALL